jgi:hypothetical protein
VSEYFPTLATITINIDGETLKTERVYEGGDGQEYPFTENLTLDGKEYKITIFDMPRKSKAAWTEQENTILIESVTTFYESGSPEDFVSKENWKVDKTTGILTISFVNSSSYGEIKGAFYYKKTG